MRLQTKCANSASEISANDTSNWALKSNSSILIMAFHVFVIRGVVQLISSSHCIQSNRLRIYALAIGASHLVHSYLAGVTQPELHLTMWSSHLVSQNENLLTLFILTHIQMSTQDVFQFSVISFSSTLQTTDDSSSSIPFKQIISIVSSISMLHFGYAFGILNSKN